VWVVGGGVGIVLFVSGVWGFGLAVVGFVVVLGVMLCSLLFGCFCG